MQGTCRSGLSIYTFSSTRSCNYGSFICISLKFCEYLQLPKTLFTLEKASCTPCGASTGHARGTEAVFK
jgi:hypothetical protein